MSLPERFQVWVCVCACEYSRVCEKVRKRACACANVCFLEMCFNLVRTPNR